MLAGVEPVRVAFVGFGNAAVSFHLPLLGAHSNTVLVGVVTPSDRSRSRAAECVPDVPVGDSLRELLEFVPDVEAVVVATPPETHCDLAGEALSLGRHVMVEKPFTQSSAQARDLFGEAARRGLLLTCFLNRRFDADFRAVANVVGGGTLGRPIRLVSTWERPGSATTPADFRRFAPSTSRGGLLGTGSHLADQALQLLGPATRVTAHRHGIGWAAGDNVSSIVIEHARGAVSEILMTSSAQRFRRRLELLGAAGQLDLQCLDETDITFARSTGTVTVQGRSEAAVVGGAAWKETYQRLAGAIRRGTTPPATHGEVIALQDVLDACLESSGRGASVAV